MSLYNLNIFLKTKRRPLTTVQVLQVLRYSEQRVAQSSVFIIQRVQSQSEVSLYIDTRSGRFNANTSTVQLNRL